MKMSDISSTFILFTSFIPILILFISRFEAIVSQDFQSLPPKLLTDETSLMGVKDYENQNLIITKKEIFSGLNPQKIGEFSTEFPQSTDFAAFNSEYILASCTNNALLSYININSANSLVETPILSYSDVDFAATTTNYVCTISFLDPYVYIVHTSESFGINFIKSKLILEGTRIVYEEKFSFSKEIENLTPKDNRTFSCEVMKVLADLSDSTLICGYAQNFIREREHRYYAMPINFQTFSFDNSKPICTSKDMLYYKVQRMNSTHSRFLIDGNSYEMYLIHTDGYGLWSPRQNLRNVYLSSFISYGDLFYYNNKYIFHAEPTDESNTNFNLYITNDVSRNNSILIAINKPLEKVQGFYDEENDKFIYIYQYAGTIEYFILQYKCFFNAWHIDSNDSIVCYDDQLYCNSNQYKYHTDTRECALSICRDGYYQFNFECYKDNCPENTNPISSENKCESALDYCYIDNHYKTHCQSAAYDEYTLKYENTKIYFNSCSYSLYLFNLKTYHFQKVCYEQCPTNTAPNDANGECECIYYKNYIDKENDIFECLGETDICKNHDNKYSKTDLKVCAINRQECIDEGYKIFNTFCYKTCPENTEAVGDNCQCLYHYYEENGELFCFSEDKSCEDIGHPTKSNTNRCFLSKDDCINKGYKFFNNICLMDSCPVNTNDNDGDGICFCSDFYYNDSETNLYDCLSSSDSCELKGYNYKINDEKQCFISLRDCRNKGFKTFNNECYTSCPSKTYDKDGDGICYCSYFSFYDSVNGLYSCFEESDTCESKGYAKEIESIKQCFISLDDCKSKGFKVFNEECYKDCPINNYEKDNAGICYCSYFYYLDSESNLYECLSENEDCESKEYTHKNTYEKQCFSSLDDCFLKGYKLFNNECYKPCPDNTYEDDDKNCYCSYFYYKDFATGLYNCLSEDEQCELKGYTYKINDIKQCFTSLDDCKQKGFKIFNNECYSSCPANTYENNGDSICYCSNYYFYDL